MIIGGKKATWHSSILFKSKYFEDIIISLKKIVICLDIGFQKGRLCLLPKNHLYKFVVPKRVLVINELISQKDARKRMLCDMYYSYNDILSSF